MYFQENPRFIELNFLNGDSGNCETNGYDYLQNFSQCAEATNGSPWSEENPINLRGCYKKDNQWKFNWSTSSFQFI